MRNETNSVRAEFLETLFHKTEAEGSWADKGKETYESTVGDLRIQLERGALGDRVAYSVWVWSPDGLVDTIYDDDLKGITPNISQFSSYDKLIKFMFERAQNTIVVDRIKAALDTLKKGTVRPSKD